MRALGLAGHLFGGLGEAGPQVRPDRCLRDSGSGCRACVEICPAAALRLGPAGSTQAPQSERSRCTDCGLCAAACPSGAITGVGVPAGALTAEADRRSLDMSVVCAATRQGPGGRLRGRLDSGSDPADPADPADRAFTVSCLAALHPETVVATALALAPSSTLTLVHGQCSQCPGAQRSRVEAVAQDSLDLLRRVTNDRPHGGDRAIALVEMSATADGSRQKITGRSRGSGRRVWSRRTLLTAGRSGARQATTPAVTAPRAELLRYSANPAAVALQLTHPVSAQGCTFCHACAAVCPTQALRISRLPCHSPGKDGTAVPLELTVDPSRCLGCGRCAQVCVDDLLRLGRGLEPASREQGSAGRFVVLAHGERSACHTCRQPMAPGEHQTCRRCESSRTLVTDVLAR